VVFLAYIRWEQDQDLVSKLSLVFLGKEGMVLWNIGFVPQAMTYVSALRMPCTAIGLPWVDSTLWSLEWSRISLFILYFPSI